MHPSLPQLAGCFKDEGFLVKVDTNGSSPDLLRYLSEKGLIDAVSMDVKSPLNEVQYARCAGVPVDLEKIKESIEWLKGGSLPYEFRTTVVPTLMREEDLYLLARQLKKSIRLTLQNFNPADPLDPKLKDAKPFTEPELRRIQEEVSSILAGESG